ncbi:biliverdin-producing heme oxygenase [Nocardioides daeguensis]|uniref:Biliverdin-producing heme oxygenase n=1 Tax=Nocardioides daeguensis TaxID=908359 RepID=A0ABP6W5M2_9ACTN|nr:biliverdin-producing heme oxygenase [Nocardioides daeguensis]MBV6727862.1 biliverdin-producing heme oxygenase [Nocardioides daeguensis]MCR1775333.1 biliverdin-producing heme oxygenase [Nocardioides daeguensis]
MSPTETDLVPLSTALREGSRAEHEAAEGSTFMAELLDGRLTAEAYADLLLRLRRVYAALEEVLAEHHADPIVAAVHDPALERLAAIDADLAHWAPGVDPEMLDSPAAAAYVERIRAGAAWGGLLAAHHYTRYLGDLSGGQVIGRVLQRTFDLPEDTGVAFYEFAQIPKPKPYKDGYRARLDALDLTSDEVDRVVEEVRAVFRLNQALFEELGEQIERYRAA